MHFKSSLWFLYDNIVGLKWIINEEIQATPLTKYCFELNVINAKQFWSIMTLKVYWFDLTTSWFAVWWQHFCWCFNYQSLLGVLKQQFWKLLYYAKNSNCWFLLLMRLYMGFYPNLQNYFFSWHLLTAV